MAATTASPPPSKSKLNPKTVRKAINALLKWRSSQTQNNPDLPNSFSSSSDDQEFTYLVLTLKKPPPKTHPKSFKIPLPNPLLPESTHFCLIYDDRPTSTLTHPLIENKIKTQNLPISKALKLSKLKSHYTSFDEKRNLIDSHDAFLADRRVWDMLPAILGKQFSSMKKKVVVPVELEKRDWKEEVEGVIRSAVVFRGTGTCSVVRVGRVGMGCEEIVENVVAAVEGIVEVAVPRKWGGVKSFHLKLLESLALPVYQVVKDETLLRMEGGNGKEKKG